MLIESRVRRSPCALTSPGGSNQPVCAHALSPEVGGLGGVDAPRDTSLFVGAATEQSRRHDKSIASSRSTARGPLRLRSTSSYRRLAPPRSLPEPGLGRFPAERDACNPLFINPMGARFEF